MAEQDKSEKNVALEPLDDRVVVERLEAEEKTAGGIVIPDTAQEKPQKARVIAAGPGKLLESGERAEMGVSVGDLILLGKYSGSEVTVEGDEYVIIRESDILAKISE
ncbi:MAG: co-chaperone GroES [Planctomycetota bacterium]